MAHILHQCFLPYSRRLTMIREAGLPGANKQSEMMDFQMVFA